MEDEREGDGELGSPRSRAGSAHASKRARASRSRLAHRPEQTVIPFLHPTRRGERGTGGRGRPCRGTRNRFAADVIRLHGTAAFWAARVGFSVLRAARFPRALPCPDTSPSTGFFGIFPTVPWLTWRLLQASSQTRGLQKQKTQKGGRDEAKIRVKRIQQ